jgi:hypothetical protein
MEAIERAIKSAILADNNPTLPNDRDIAPQVENFFIGEGTETIGNRPRKLGKLFSLRKKADLSAHNFDSTVPLRSAGHITLSPLIVDVVKEEGPVHFEDVVDRIREYWGNAKTSTQIRERIVSAIKAAVRSGDIQYEDPEGRGQTSKRFLRRSGQRARPRRPRMRDKKSRRPIERISEQEITAGILMVSKVMFGGSQEEIVTQTVKEFGYRARTKNLAKIFNAIVNQLIKDGLLRRDAKGLISNS